MEKFEKLRKMLKELPGVGDKTAERLAFFLLTGGRGIAEPLAKSIVEAAEAIKLCSVCGALSEEEVCGICNDTKREPILMIVEKPRDVLIFEKSGYFKGKYHVLGNLLSPLDGIGPDELGLDELTRRIEEERYTEIILALSPTTEGETTSAYISRILAEHNLRITRIAFGIPFGSDFEFVDQFTISKSLKNRYLIDKNN